MLEHSLELVGACSERQEVELVVLVALASDVEGVCTSDEETRLLTLDFPSCVEAQRLSRPVLDWHNEVVLLLGEDGLSDLAFLLRRS